MAQKVTVELVDDLNGTPIAEGEGGTVTFALQRKSYEIDLSTKNIEKLEAALAPFIGAARPAGAEQTKTTSPTRSRRVSSGHDLAAVRAWARENGHEVSDRGRVPTPVLEAFDAAH